MTTKLNFAKYIFEKNKFQPSKVAYIDDAESITYADLELRARGFAENLVRENVKSGDHVLLLMLDSVDYPVALLGCVLLGAVAILGNPRATASTIKSYLNNEKIVAVVADDLVLPLIDTEALVITRSVFEIMSFPSKYDPVTTNADDEAYWLYTSGGAGEPKAAIHKHSTLIVAGYLYGQCSFKYEPDDIVFSVAKLPFSYGITHAFECSLAAGCTAILMSKLPTPQSILKVFRTYNPTIFAGVPATYVGLLTSDLDLDLTELNIRCCLSAGEALPLTLAEQWENKTNLKLYDVYGSAEFSGAILLNFEDNYKFGTLGKPIAGIEVELRNIQNDIGDMYVKGATKALRYNINTDIDFEDEWFPTGDKFIKDKDGYFKFVGRNNDMLRVNANWVSPIEVENIISRNPYIKEVGVTGFLDEHGLTQVAAFVVTNTEDIPSNLNHQIKTLVRQNTDFFKCPKKIQIVDSLPRNANGKLQRWMLKLDK